MPKFSAMLAKDADLNKLRFPHLASAKLDGIRVTIINGVAMSRSLKPIPNKQIQTMFANCEYFDGELIVGSPMSKTCYNDTVSVVMSQDKDASGVRLYAFDHIEEPTANYTARSAFIKHELNNDNVIILEQVVIHNLEELLAFEEECLNKGYEGLILRDPMAPYKFGRSTVNEGYLLKLKRFEDAEAVVVGFEERMHNANEAVTNELGRTSRSSHQAGKVPTNTLGALVCEWNGMKFNIGTGFDDAERQRVWDDREGHLNKLAKFKFFPIGMMDAPRHPVFLGWRDRMDT